MFSFNAVLCAIAFGGVLKRDGFWVVISTIITVIIDDYMIKIGIPPYTFPFVATMWIILYSRKGITFVGELIPNKKTSGIENPIFLINSFLSITYQFHLIFFKNATI
jgi:urea transporter